MSYCFNPKSSVRDELLRVVEERIQHAIRCIADYPSPDPEGLHSARKDIKKLRSLLRLLRGKAFQALRSSLNRELRGMGLDLSTRRDQEVLSAMLSDWRKRSDVRKNQTLKNAVQGMCRQIEQTRSTSSSLDPSVEGSIKRRFAHVSDTLNQADLESLSWDSLAKAARKRVERLKQAEAAYLANPNAETLHEWRKQLKNRLHHLKLLRKLGSPSKCAIKRVRKLEALLGSARDHDLLMDTLLNSTHTGLNVRELGALLTYTESQKEMRLRKALHQAGNKFMVS